MDFDLAEEHHEITELAGRILQDHIDIEVLREIEASSEWFDKELLSLIHI